MAAPPTLSKSLILVFIPTAAMAISKSQRDADDSRAERRFGDQVQRIERRQHEEAKHETGQEGRVFPLRAGIGKATDQERGHKHHGGEHGDADQFDQRRGIARGLRDGKPAPTTWATSWIVPPRNTPPCTSSRPRRPTAIG